MKYGIIYVLALFLAVRCAYTDWTEQKIYNKHTLPSIWIGLAVNLLLWGADGLIESFFGLLLGFSFFLLFVLGGLKAGDVKLYMALGAIVGWRMELQIMISSILLGGFWGIVLLLCNKNSKERFQGLWLYVKSVFLTRKYRRYEAEGKDAYLCFGICIAIGTFLTIGFHIGCEGGYIWNG